MDPLHIVLLVLAALITACQFVATNFPATEYALIAHGIAGVAASLMPMLGAYSKQLVPPVAPGTLAAQVSAQTNQTADALAAPVLSAMGPGQP